MGEPVRVGHGCSTRSRSSGREFGVAFILQKKSLYQFQGPLDESLSEFINNHEGKAVGFFFRFFFFNFLFLITTVLGEQKVLRWMSLGADLP